MIRRVPEPDRIVATQSLSVPLSRRQRQLLDRAAGLAGATRTSVWARDVLLRSAARSCPSKTGGSG